MGLNDNWLFDIYFEHKIVISTFQQSQKDDLSQVCASDYLCLVVTTGKGLISWLSFVVYNCEFVTFLLVFVTFPLVSWVRCGIVRPVKRDWAVLSKDTPVDISI